MRILITGVTGFAGGHLAEALLEQAGVQLIGTSRTAGWPAALGQLAQRVTLHACDLTIADQVNALLRNVQPEQIYHLAGYAHAGRSFQEVDAAWAGNLTATRTLYEAVLRWGGRPRIVYVGSGLIYGDAQQQNQAFNEQCLLRPSSPYATSKAAADLASYQYATAPARSRLEIIRARPFNHIGPRQAPEFAIAHFAQQLAAIERGEQPPILRTGDLRPARDVTDVRDTVQAYLLLMRHGEPAEAYNIGTGIVHSMRDMLDRLISLSGLHVDVQPQADLRREAEILATRCDAAALTRATGWQQRYSLEQTLHDTLTYWRLRS